MKELGKPVLDSFATIRQSLQEYRSDELAIAFNGGKDSVVLLYLLDLAFKLKSKETQDSSYNISHICTIFIDLEHSFKEVNEYVREVVDSYNLKLVTLTQFKEGLKELKEEYPHIKGIYMGTRRDDPYGATLPLYKKTDPGWPDFMRIHPILDLSYQDIWNVIQRFGLSYCKLYDEGYTSIGETNNTIPNPALQYTDHQGNTKYYPAYMLQDGSKERDGRIKK
uniref:FAD synthase n=1 Tax=Arcella intermedia TaxID=1963864 RepID=A0A6B2LGX7_9EUKA